MTKESKAKFYLARFHSLSNAAEFIRSHGEEGFGFIDNELDSKYKSSNQLVGHQLNQRAMRFWYKYEALGIDIDSESND